MMGEERLKRIVPILEAGEEKIDTQIQEIFRYADKDVMLFSPMWRCKIRCKYMGFSFSKLLTAFHERYGRRVMHNQPSSPQLAILQKPQDMIIGGGSDFADKCSDLDMNTTEEILKRLPVPSLMRAKTVCKEWNRTISATTFNLVNHHHQLFVTQHMMQGYHGIAFFSSELNQWFRIPLLARTKERSNNRLCLCAAAAGFYLFDDWDDMLVVINPITKQRMELPPLPEWYGWRDGTAVELIAHSSCHFEIIGLGFHETQENCFTLLYNSTTNKWTGVPAIPAVVPYWTEHYWTSSLYNGIVYSTCDYGLHLGCYDIASKTFEFKEVKGGLPPQINFRDHDDNSFTSLPSLVVCRGKLLLVGRLMEEVGGSIWGRVPFTKHSLVGIWELDNKRKVWFWFRISATPKDLFEDTVKSSHGTDFMVAATLDQIWLTIRGSRNVLTLDMKSMNWNVLPGCPSTEDLVDTFPRHAVFGTFSIHNSSFFC